jgi:hypothetical protein
MPQYVWDGWERWMAENPDHPSHRDQLACDIATLLLRVQGSEIEYDALMQMRMRDPNKGK